MRRSSWVVLLAPILAGACSASIPRLPSAYSPPPATAAPVETPAPSDAAAPAETAPAFDTSAWTKLAPSGESFTILMPAAA